MNCIILLRKLQLLFTIFFVKRAMGIEPTYPAWKAGVLPLNYARRSLQSTFYVLSHTVGVTGFEPATSWSQTRRSSQAEPHPGCFEIACSSSVFVPTAVEQREYHYKTHIGICQHFLQNFFYFFLLLVFARFSKENQSRSLRRVLAPL